MKDKDRARLMEESNKDRVTDPNIVVYYLDESFGKHYMFIADNIVTRKSPKAEYQKKNKIKSV